MNNKLLSTKHGEASLNHVGVVNATGKWCQLDKLLYKVRGAGLAQCWEPSPPTNVSRVRLSDPSHRWVEFVVGCLLCSEMFFSGFSGFLLSSIKPTFLNSNLIWIIVKNFILSPWLGWLHKHSLMVLINVLIKVSIFWWDFIFDAHPHTFHFKTQCTVPENTHTSPAKQFLWWF